MRCMRSSISHLPSRSRLLTALLAICALLSALAPSAQARSACQSASATPAKTDKLTIVRATLCTINAERSRRGMASLKLNKRLSKAATAHAGDMNARNYFSHNSLGGGSFVDRIRRAGYFANAKSWTVGENLAWGARSRGTPRMVTKMWMKSPGHRANILNSSFREIGIGVSYGAPVTGVGGPAATYTTDFGARR
jgi:uncharacterized protein YkwD